jgi:transposase-like protein
MPTAPAYPDEFRRQAVDLVPTERLSIADAARRLGVDASTLRKWVKKYRPTAVPTPSAAAAVEPATAAAPRREPATEDGARHPTSEHGNLDLPFFRPILRFWLADDGVRPRNSHARIEPGSGGR